MISSPALSRGCQVALVELDVAGIFDMYGTSILPVDIQYGIRAVHTAICLDLPSRDGAKRAKGYEPSTFSLEGESPSRRCA